MASEGKGTKIEQDVVMEDLTTPKDKESQKMFSLKKWNAIAMWSWDVECDTCAICRVQVMVVWGECNHSFHNCCMSLWVVQNNRCPLCQQEWVVQRIGR
ncbi:RING-box protein 2 isoform X2 [Nematostella vectensis]|uniref:RING-box protein 2 isoform X2 n=1 Tax=Nematostella vectensis TaxID=45351 RepID=UPI00207744D0|nr:RING-box protein 2 isoform X2 [Nematostella vectensis]